MGVTTLILRLNCASVIGQQHPAFAPWIGPRAREAQDVPDLVKWRWEDQTSVLLYFDVPGLACARTSRGVGELKPSQISPW